MRLTKKVGSGVEVSETTWVNLDSCVPAAVAVSPADTVWYI